MSLLEKLYTDKTFCDVIFMVDGREIKAHRCILAAESEYFAKMFTSSFREKSGPITITETPYKLFRDVITFVYTDEINIDAENFLDIVNISEMFFIDRLRKRCTDRFRDIFTSIDQFLDMLPYIKNISFIKEVCIKYIVELWDKLINNNKFYELLQDDSEFLKDIFHAVSLKNPEYENPSVSVDDMRVIEREMEAYANHLKDPQVVSLILEALDNSDLFKHPDNIRQTYHRCSLSMPYWYVNKYEKYFKHSERS